MSVNNLGTTGAAWVGGHIYDLVGLNWLIAISAATTAACFVLVPWVRVPETPRAAP
jgi:predicted MFS family arabinose efflux permease